MKHARVTIPDVQNRLPLLAKEIEAILPHRYPFLFIDQVIEFEDGEGIVGLKSVSMGEPYFQGHFPGNPIMPGVIILEALAQLGAIYAKVCSAGVPPETLIVFSGADEVRFRKPVYPGSVLRLEMKVLRVKFGHWKMDGRAFVGGERVAEAIFTATELARGVK